MSAAIELSEDIKRIADQRAADRGYRDVATYVESLIVADAGGPISEELEAHLLKSLQSPGIQVTPEYVESKHRALEEWYRKGRP
jgi:hypothetical protein